MAAKKTATRKTTAKAKAAPAAKAAGFSPLLLVLAALAGVWAHWSIGTPGETAGTFLTRFVIVTGLAYWALAGLFKGGRK